MPKPYVELPQDVFNYATDWLESIDSTAQPGGGGHSSAESQERVITGLIPFNKDRSAEAYFVGGSYTQFAAGDPNATAFGYALQRAQPAIHPTRWSLRAYTYSSQGFIPASNPLNPNGEPYVISPFPGAYGETLRSANYQLGIATIRFKSFGRMRFLPDSAIRDYTQEWQRNFLVSTEPSIDTLQAEGSSFLKFAEGPTPPNGVPVSAPIAILQAKARYVGFWMGVAHDYVSTDPVYLKPDKIVGCLGTVNRNLLWGIMPAGTMLLVGVKFDPILFPLQSSDPTDIPFTGWNVTFVWDYFNPPNGANLPPSMSNFAGHNLLPWRGSGVVGDPFGGYYFYCTRTGNVNDQPLIQYTNMNALVQNANDPTPTLP